MNPDYFTARLDLLAANGVEVDRSSTTAKVQGITAISKDPLGRLMLQQVEEVLNAQGRLEDACEWLERKVESTRASVSANAMVTEQVASVADDFARAATTQNMARNALAGLAELWVEKVRLENLPLLG
jgi:hypothetical protein